MSNSCCLTAILRFLQSEAPPELSLTEPRSGFVLTPEKIDSLLPTLETATMAKSMGKEWIVRGMKPLYKPATPSAAYRFCKVLNVLPTMRFYSWQTIKTLATSNGCEIMRAPSAKPASIGSHELPKALGRKAVMRQVLRRSAAE